MKIQVIHNHEKMSSWKALSFLPFRNSTWIQHGCIRFDCIVSYMIVNNPDMPGEVYIEPSENAYQDGAE